MARPFKFSFFLGCIFLIFFTSGYAQITTIASESDTLEESSPVEFRRAPSEVTYDSVFNVLCKGPYPGEARINGVQVKMYKTGIFFKEVKFKPGNNVLRAEVTGTDGQKVIAETEVVYKPGGKPKPDASSLWLDTLSVQPVEDHVLLSEDQVKLSFRGAKGKSAYARIRPGNLKILLSRKDFADFSLYEGTLWLSQLKKNKPYKITYVLEGGSGKSLKIPSPSKLKVKDPTDFPMVETQKEKALLTFNLGPVRLGGPIISELPSGVKLQVNGEIGDFFRIHLDRNHSAMISKESVGLLPTTATQPGYFLQYASAVPAENADLVNIPYSEPVPYAIFPEPDLQRIRVVLYGVKTSSTWLSHRQGLKIVDKLTWQQTTPDTYEMIVQLKTSDIWGYELNRTGNFLQLQVKHPPVFEKNEAGLPVKGLVVAIEAGHGGHNTGATGLSGMWEKDVNLAVAQKLARICRDQGIEVVMVRETDTYMSLQDKREAVEASKAHLLISIHANSANPRGDYLRVGGVSTYYHNPFWADFAEIMYDELLKLPLDEFGVVGSFNYLVTRVSSRPAILVEQGFMSHAEDEEKLADPDFREQMADKIFQGMANYLQFMQDQ